MATRKKTLLGIFFIICVIISVHYLGWLNQIEDFIRSIIAPGSQIMYNLSVRVGETEDKFDSQEELLSSYKNLKEKLIAAQIDRAKFRLSEKENEELRKSLGFSSQKKYRAIGAEVIGKNIDPIGNTLIINRGFADGISEENPAIIHNGVLVGKITKVKEKISLVQLINDSQSKIAATIINKDESVGLVEGGYGISIHLNYIPQNEDINVGDMVVTSGLEGGIPRGLLIGSIETVEKEAYQPFQKAVIKPVSNLDKIRLVSVITGSTN